MAKPRKFPSDIQKYFIITKILKQCDLESQGRLLSVVSDHSEAERNQATQDQNSFENFFIRIYLQVLTQQKMTLNIISKQPSYYSLIKILLFPLLMIQHYIFNGFGETTSQKYADEPNLLKKNFSTCIDDKIPLLIFIYICTRKQYCRKALRKTKTTQGKNSTISLVFSFFEIYKIGKMKKKIPLKKKHHEKLI